MGTIRLKTSKLEVATMVAVAAYWGWVLIIFYASSFHPMGSSSSEIGFWNIGSHIVALFICSFAWNRLKFFSLNCVFVVVAAVISSFGTGCLFFGTQSQDPVVQTFGGIASGLGSGGLLLCWSDALGKVEEDSRRRNILGVSIIVAVVLYIAFTLLPRWIHPICAVTMIALSAFGSLRAEFGTRASASSFQRAVSSCRLYRAAKARWCLLLLCTFLFSVPLAFFRVGESGGVGLSVFSGMLLCLCVLFCIDYMLRKFHRHSVMPHLFVLLTSGGMLMLPFLVQGDVFLAGLLIHTGGFAFRAFMYPEFVRIARCLNESPALYCAWGTIAIDCGQAAGTILRNFLFAQSDQWLVHAAMVLAYALFFVAFLLFTRRFDTEVIDRADQTNREVASVGERCCKNESGGGEPQPSSPHPMIAGVEYQCDCAAVAYGLSAKETEVLKLAVRGRSVASMAKELVLSPNTVKTHIAHIYRKCGVHSREDLVSLVESESVLEHCSAKF